MSLWLMFSGQEEIRSIKILTFLVKKIKVIQTKSDYQLFNLPIPKVRYIELDLKLNNEHYLLCCISD